MVVEWWLGALLVSAVPGTPEPVKPVAGLPELAGRFYDDDLGYRPDRPHYRTWQLTAALKIEHVVISIDHTTLDGPVVDRRIDVLSGSLAWTDALDHDEDGGAWYCVGAGGRGRGDYDGGWIQQRGHQLLHDNYTATPYEDDSSVDGYAFLNAGWLRWTPAWTSARLRAGIEATASGEAVTDGQLQSALKLRAVGAIGPVSAWLGIVDSRHSGDSDSDAEQEVLEHEEGLMWIGGFSAWWFSYALVWLPDAEVAGAVSAEFGF